MREAEIAEAARKRCPVNIVKVGYFMQGARWADAHPENKWHGFDETPDGFVEAVIVGCCNEFHIGCYRPNEKEWIDYETGDQICPPDWWMPIPELPKQKKNDTY
jgi:hypothetical protein